MIPTTKFEKSESFLVAMREDGKFLWLDESDVQFTIPNYVGNPIDARKVYPHQWCVDRLVLNFDDIHEAPYYFENSDRMREWLKGCKMVKVTLHSVAIVE